MHFQSKKFIKQINWTFLNWFWYSTYSSKHISRQTHGRSKKHAY